MAEDVVTSSPSNILYPSSALDSPSRKSRTIVLHPGSWGDTVRCDLREHNFPRPGFWHRNFVNAQYEALSYTWGSSNSGCTITLNDVDSYPLTNNLAASLRRLRQPDWGRSLWIDGLCINQRDMTEQGAQVARMRDIYANAAEVLVWFGEVPGAPESDTPHLSLNIRGLAGKDLGADL